MMAQHSGGASRPRLETLGHLVLLRPDGTVSPQRRKGLALLAYLASGAGERVPRATLAALLWPESQEDRARHSLRQALAELRPDLGEHLRADSETVQLRPGWGTWDVEELMVLLDRRDSTEAVARIRGEFLAGLDDLGGEGWREWLESERVHVHRAAIMALDAAVQGAERSGDWTRAIAWARQRASLTPLDEAAHSRVIRVLRLAGHDAAALAYHAQVTATIRLQADREPSTAFAALAATRRDPSRAPTGAPLAPGLVGRDEVLNQLDVAWGERAAGGSALRLVGGPGLGKSRVVHEFVNACTHRGEAHSVVVRALPDESDRPWGLLRELVERMRPVPGFRGIAPSALEVLKTAAAGGSPPAADVGAALADALGAIASERPIVIVVDDADKADGDSARAIVAMARRTPAGALVLLTNSGERERPAQADLRAISLQPLDGRDVEAMVATMVTMAPAERRVLAERLHAAGGGNPGYVVEVLLALVERGTLTPAPDGGWRLQDFDTASALPLPESLAASLRERLSRCSAEARTLLTALSASGGRAAHGALVRAAGLGAERADRATEELLSRRLVRAHDGEVLEVEGELVRDVALEGVSPARRERLRAGVAGERRPRWRRAGLVAAGLAAAAVTGVLVVAPSPGRSGGALVVLPFEVRGDSAVGYLREGMVDLMSAGLDGTGPLRVVRARGAITALAANGGRPGKGDIARTMQALDADFLVTGQITTSGQVLHMRATLHAAASPSEPLARAAASGPVDSVASLADQLTALLVAGIPGQHRLTPVAVTTSSSLPAIKAYLAGEQAYRRIDLAHAREEFRSAVALDSAFALAWYRLAYTESWGYRDSLAREAADRALATSGPLPERHRALIRAQHAYLHGQADGAERLYRSLVSAFPRDVDAWTGLAEVLTHHNWHRGRSLEEARAPWQQVLGLEPDNIDAISHMPRMESLRGTRTALTAAYERLLQRNLGDAQQVWIRACRDLGWRPGASRARDIGAGLAGTVGDAEFWILLIMECAARVEGLEGAVALAERLIDPSRLPEARALGHVIRAYLLVGLGADRAALADLRAARALDGSLGLMHLAYLRSTAGGAFDTAEPVRDALLEWDPPVANSDGGALQWFAIHRGRLDVVRRYLIGLDALRSGDTLHAREAMAEPDGEGRRAELIQRLRASIEARIAAARGDSAGALRVLERSWDGIDGTESTLSPFHSRPADRMLQAALLRQAGRTGEAEGWERSLRENSLWDRAYGR